MSNSSSRRDRQLNLFYEFSSNGSTNSKSMIGNVDTSKYEQTMANYKSFLQILENKIEKVYEKENYRIYLNDRTNEKTYNSLVEQKNNLLKAIEQSKDYRQSANRQLIEQVMQLQRQKQEYIDRNDNVLQRINKKKQQISKRKEELKQLQKEIKSYWVYSYDLTNNSCMSKSSFGSYRNGHKRKCSEDKENMSRYYNDSNLNGVSINNNNSQRSYLPSIVSPKSISNNISSSNASSIINKSQSITVFSKDLSLINSSPTRQKFIQKINLSCKQQAQNKLQYEREKISLLKMFCAYIKKLQENQKGINDRIKLEKVANELLEKISHKETKLNQIEKLIK